MSTNRFATHEPKVHQNGDRTLLADRGKTKAPPSTNGVAKTPEVASTSGVTARGTAPHPQPLTPGGRGETHGAAPHPRPRVPEGREEPTRDSNGRFAPGNAGGPGNPFGRLAAALRRALIETTSADDIREIAKRLLEMAKAGNVPAAKLLFAYTIGKPAAAPNPDTLDQEEWQILKDTAPMMRELSQVKETPDPFLPLTVARTWREATTRDLSGMFGVGLMLPDTNPKLAARMGEMSKEEQAQVLRGLARVMRAEREKEGAAEPRSGAAPIRAAKRDSSAKGK